jgi:hypothetical protein
VKPRRAAAGAIALACAGAFAQGTSPAPATLTFPAPEAPLVPLVPLAPGRDAAPGTLLRASQNGVDYALNAAVARIVVEVDRDQVPADGQAPLAVTVRVFGRDGQPLATPAWLTLEASGGRLLLPGARTDEAGPRGLDADPATPGVQWKVEGGTGRFTLLAPFEPQRVRLRVSAGTEEAAGDIHFVPDHRPMVSAGLIEGILNLRERTALTPARRGDGFEQEIERWARAFNDGKSNLAARTAFYLKGTVQGSVLLTAAFDSDKATRARLLRDVRPEEFYPVYGDASLRSFDARSAERLYVRVDHGRSYALYGDFVTGDGFTQPLGQGAVASLKQRSLGAVNRSATGLRAHHESAAFAGNVFAFRDTLRQVVEEFRSQGSGPYGLSNDAVLEGSDKVEVLVRDRFQPARILAVRPLVRLVDYTFEPFSGRILLTQFLPAVDADLNPLSLRVSYEVDQGGEAFWVLGADGQWKANEALELGGSAMQDKNPLAPYELASANATIRLGTHTALVVEGARSRSTVNTNPANQTSSPALASRIGEVTGDAARVELAHEGARTDARLSWGRTSPLFVNPAAPLQGGREEFFGRLGWRFADAWKVYAEALRSEDRRSGGGRYEAAAGGLRWTASEALTLDMSLRRARETVGTASTGALTWPFDQTSGLGGSLATGSAGGALGFGNPLLDPATGLPVIRQQGLVPVASSLPPGTELDTTTLRLGAGWRAGERLVLGAEVEGSVEGDRRRRVALGGDWLLTERSKLYARWERQSGWVQLAGVSDRGASASQFVFGVDSTFLADTQLFSEYRLRDAIGGRDLQLASGIRQAFDLAEGWRANVGVEHLKVLSGATATASAVTAGLDWTADPLWRASTRVEFRRSGDVEATAENERFDTVLWQVLVARKLDRDWTLLARDHLLKTDYATRGGVLQNRAQLGLAYRDTDTNRVNALAKLEHKLEKDASDAAAGELKTSAWIVSAHADWHPSRPWWLTGRLAGKWQRDRFEQGVEDSFRARLVSGRVVYDLTEHWDLGVMAAAMFGQRGARQHALGAEVGYLLRQNLWLSAGVNAAGFAGDADLTGYEYTRKGAYLRLRFKFDETLFKGRDREVNRSLDR